MNELEELAAEFIRKFKPDMNIENTKVSVMKNARYPNESVVIETALVQNYIKKLGTTEKR